MINNFNVKKVSLLITAAIIVSGLGVAFKQTYLNSHLKVRPIAEQKESLSQIFTEISNIPGAQLAQSEFEEIDSQVSYVAVWTTEESIDTISGLVADSLRTKGWSVPDPVLQDDGEAKWFSAAKGDYVINADASISEDSGKTKLMIEIFDRTGQKNISLVPDQSSDTAVLGESTGTNPNRVDRD